MVLISAANAPQDVGMTSNKPGKVNGNDNGQESTVSIFAKSDTEHGENVKTSEITSQEAGTNKQSATLSSQLDNIKQSVNNLTTTMKKTSIAQKMLGLANSITNKTQNIATDISYQTTQEGANKADAEANNRINMMNTIINEAKTAAQKDIENEAKKEMNEIASKYDTNLDEKVSADSESGLKEKAANAKQEMKQAGISEETINQTSTAIDSNVHDVGYDITQQDSVKNADETIKNLENNIDEIVGETISNKNTSDIEDIDNSNGISQEDIDELNAT